MLLNVNRKRTRTAETGLDRAVLDCLGSFGGCLVDLAGTGAGGEPIDQQELRHSVVVTALDAVEERIRPGIYTEDIRRLTRETMAGFGHRPELVSVTTYGIFGEVFELPAEDSLETGHYLEQGMVLNTEVFHRDPGRGSFHLEDSVRIEVSGLCLLHPVTRQLVAIA